MNADLPEFIEGSTKPSREARKGSDCLAARSGDGKVEDAQVCARPRPVAKEES